jgi:DNA-binding XRE family transcriptional regulator
MDSCCVPGGVGFRVASEAILVRRSGPDACRRPECVPYCSNPDRVSTERYINTFAIETYGAAVDLPWPETVLSVLMTDFDEIYRAVGRKIRQTRESQHRTQDSLAQRLGISRTSMVNIEAGRQRPPLHLLWQIAELLETKLTLLIPSPEELLGPQSQTVLDKEMMKQIEDVANGDPATIKVLTGFVTRKLKRNGNTPDAERKAHGKTKSRRKS